MDERFKETFFRWLAQKKRRSNYTYQSQELLDVYGKLVDYSGNDPEKAATIVGKAERGNWADLYPLNQAKGSNAREPRQQTYLGAAQGENQQYEGDPRYNIGTTL